MKKIELQEGRDFTPRSLADFLNDLFDCKESGKPFNLSDIQQYTIRGYLPEQYGKHPIKQIAKTNDSIGVNVVRVDFDSRY